MPFLFRKAIRVGPKWAHVQFNISKSGISRTYRLFGFLSHNSRSGKARVDLPGPVSWTSRGSTKKAKRI